MKAYITSDAALNKVGISFDSSSFIIVNFLVVFILISTCINCVIVDGDKKDDISPVKHQKHNASSLIDSYNVKTCGIADPDYEEHEFVNMARAGQFPWIVSFQIKTGSDDEIDDSNDEKKIKPKDQSRSKKIMYEDLHFCCGTFISSKWILTAAHCFATELKVVGGSHKVSSRSRESRNMTIKSIFYHKQFNVKIPVGFDIALVELNEPVKFSQRRVLDDDRVQSEPFHNAACLPRRGHQNYFNETARISGWGLSNQKDPSSMPSKLLTTDILLAETKECAQIYSNELKSAKPVEQFRKYADFICGSYAKTRDACQSDSGGPLMQYVDNKAVVIGIVSYGIGCARKGVPGLYTRTSVYINWIKDITERGREASVDFELLEPKTEAPDGNSTTTSRPISATRPSNKTYTNKNIPPKSTQKSDPGSPAPKESKLTNKSIPLETKKQVNVQIVPRKSNRAMIVTTEKPANDFEFAE